VSGFRGIIRFQVMVILQAARAKQLGLSIREAKSWGLNRAIFYAALKRGFRKTNIPPRRRADKSSKIPVTRKKTAYYLGDELAYSAMKNGCLYFSIGETLQTEEDFQRQIMKRFGSIYSTAWKEALQIVRQCPKEVLLSQNSFFREVYRARRDELASKWTGMTAED
jgi:hypothetical protein